MVVGNARTVCRSNRPLNRRSVTTTAQSSIEPRPLAVGRQIASTPYSLSSGPSTLHLSITRWGSAGNPCAVVRITSWRISEVVESITTPRNRADPIPASGTQEIRINPISAPVRSGAPSVLAPTEKLASVLASAATRTAYRISMARDYSATHAATGDSRSRDQGPFRTSTLASNHP